MMGLGIGLTPSADDYLQVWRLFYLFPGIRRKIQRGILSRSATRQNNTTLLSAITLEAALQQRCRENIHRFIHNIIYDIPGNATRQ
ncbi:DUF2877 domain-containing protein [Shigella flexneri]